MDRQPSIQHKPTLDASALAIENDSYVPATGFDFDALTGDGIQNDERVKLWADGAMAMLALVNAGNTTERAGRRARLIAFFLGVSDCKNQSELAVKVGMTPPAVSQQLNSLHGEFARIRERFSTSHHAELNNSPVSRISKGT